MDSDSQPQKFFAGEFRHAIDEKNRITIPASWREDEGEEFIILPEPEQSVSPRHVARGVCPHEHARPKQIPRSPRASAESSPATCMRAPSTAHPIKPGPSRPARRTCARELGLKGEVALVGGQRPF